MAQKFWVLTIGGAWDATAGLKWSNTSGGVGGQAVPTNADDVIFDGNSGSGTVTVQTAVAVAGSVNASAFTGTLAEATNMNIGSATAGDFILGAGMSFSFSAGAIKLTTTKVSNTSIDLAGKTVGNFTVNGNGASFVLANDINASLACAFSGGTVDFNGFNVTAGNLSNGNTLTRTVNMRGGTITLTGTGAIFDAPAGVLTFSWTSGAKIVISNTSASAKSFAGGTNATLPIIEVMGATSAGIVTFSGAFTAAGLKFDPDSSVKFTSGVTTTISTAAGINMVGTSGHPITIQSTTPGSPATISVASGVVACDYLSLKDSTATGGATFYAGSHSVDNGGNSGWIFSDPPAPPTTIAVTDTTVMSESVSIQIITIYPLSVTDTIPVIDTPTIAIQTQASVTDTTAVSDSAVLELINQGVNVTDTTVVSESVSIELINQGIAVTDTTVVSDSPRIEIISFINVTDTTPVTDSSHAGALSQIAITDTVPVTDSVQVRILLQINVTDTTPITESLRFTSAEGMKVTDIIPVTDSVQLRVMVPPNFRQNVVQLGWSKAGYKVGRPVKATGYIVEVGFSEVMYTVQLGWRKTGYIVQLERDLSGYDIALLP